MIFDKENVMPESAGSNLYDKLGVREIINARGNSTIVGGSSPDQVITQAMDDAGSRYVDMEELLEKSGDYIAEVLGVEAAYVTSGCAASQTLSTAACMAGIDPDKIARLPDTTGMKNEFLIQKVQRYPHERHYRSAGGKLVEFGTSEECTLEQLKMAIGPNTAGVTYLVEVNSNPLILPLKDVVNVAHQAGVPVITDSTLQNYPLNYFREIAQSADLVCFGGKYFGAPQSTGLVCGKKDFVKAVAANGFIAFQLDGGLASGRGMKVDRQEIVGMVAAIDSWFTMNHEERLLDYETKLLNLYKQLSDVPNSKVTLDSDHIYFKVWGDCLRIVVNSDSLGKNAEEIKNELEKGDPSIWLILRDENTLELHPNTLEDGQENIVAEELRRVLSVV